MRYSTITSSCCKTVSAAHACKQRFPSPHYLSLSAAPLAGILTAPPLPHCPSPFLSVCNPSKHLNVNGIQLTQTELTRVNAAHAKFVDEGMREAIRRLMSWGQSIMTGWGPFEAMDMCDAIGCEFVYTTSAYDPALGSEQLASPSAMADPTYANAEEADGFLRS